MGPDEASVIDLVKKLADAGANVLPDFISPKQPHFDLMIPGDTEQTERNKQLARDLGAVELGNVDFVKTMREYGVWEKTTPEDRAAKRAYKTQKKAQRAEVGEDEWSRQYDVLSVLNATEPGRTPHV